MWGLFGTIGDLLDRDGSGWQTLGDRRDYERLFMGRLYILVRLTNILLLNGR